MPSTLRLPSWFIQHCVQTPSQLADLEEKLVVQDVTASGGAHAPTAKSTRLEKDAYEIEASVWLALTHDILHIDDKASNPKQDSARQTSWFLHDSVLLRLPGKESASPARANSKTVLQKPTAVAEKTTQNGSSEESHLREGGQEFLTAVVQRVAQSCNADLITLGIDDIRDLSEYIVTERMGSSVSTGERTFVDMLFAPETVDYDKYLPNSPVAQKSGRSLKQKFAFSKYPRDLPDIEVALKAAVANSVSLGTAQLFQAVFSTIAARRSQNGSKATPLVVHIPDIFRVCDEAEHRAVFRQLGDVLEQIEGKASSGQHNIIIIATTETPEVLACEHDDCLECQPEDSKLLSFLSSNPREEAFLIFPRKTQSQKRLFELDAERKTEEANIRLLKRCLRQLPLNRTLPLAQPDAKWELPSGSHAWDLLRKGPLEKAESMARAIGKSASVDRVCEVLERPYHYNAAKVKWMKEDSVESFRWESTLTPDVQEVIRRIQSDEMFKFEAPLLDTIVDPGKLPFPFVRYVRRDSRVDFLQVL